MGVLPETSTIPDFLLYTKKTGRKKLSMEFRYCDRFGVKLQFLDKHRIQHLSYSILLRARKGFNLAEMEVQRFESLTGCRLIPKTGWCVPGDDRYGANKEIKPPGPRQIQWWLEFNSGRCINISDRSDEGPQQAEDMEINEEFSDLVGKCIVFHCEGENIHLDRLLVKRLLVELFRESVSSEQSTSSAISAAVALCLKGRAAALRKPCTRFAVESLAVFAPFYCLRSNPMMEVVVPSPGDSLALSQMARVLRSSRHILSISSKSVSQDPSIMQFLAEAMGQSRDTPSQEAAAQPGFDFKSHPMVFSDNQTPKALPKVLFVINWGRDTATPEPMAPVFVDSGFFGSRVIGKGVGDEASMAKVSSSIHQDHCKWFASLRLGEKSRPLPCVTVAVSPVLFAATSLLTPEQVVDIETKLHEQMETPSSAGNDMVIAGMNLTLFEELKSRRQPSSKRKLKSTELLAYCGFPALFHSLYTERVNSEGWVAALRELYSAVQDGAQTISRMQQLFRESLSDKDLQPQTVQAAAPSAVEQSPTESNTPDGGLQYFVHSLVDQYPILSGLHTRVIDAASRYMHQMSTTRVGGSTTLGAMELEWRANTRAWIARVWQQVFATSGEQGYNSVATFEHVMGYSDPSSVLELQINHILEHFLAHQKKLAESDVIAHSLQQQLLKFGSNIEDEKINWGFDRILNFLQDGLFTGTKVDAMVNSLKEELISCLTAVIQVACEQFLVYLIDVGTGKPSKIRGLVGERPQTLLEKSVRTWSTAFLSDFVKTAVKSAFQSLTRGKPFMHCFRHFIQTSLEQVKEAKCVELSLEREEVGSSFLQTLSPEFCKRFRVDCVAAVQASFQRTGSRELFMVRCLQRIMDDLTGEVLFNSLDSPPVNAMRNAIRVLWHCGRHRSENRPLFSFSSAASGTVATGGNKVPVRSAMKGTNIDRRGSDANSFWWNTSHAATLADCRSAEVLSYDLMQQFETLDSTVRLILAQSENSKIPHTWLNTFVSCDEAEPLFCRPLTLTALGSPLCPKPLAEVLNPSLANPAVIGPARAPAAEASDSALHYHGLRPPLQTTSAPCMAVQKWKRDGARAVTIEKGGKLLESSLLDTGAVAAALVFLSSSAATPDHSKPKDPLPTLGEGLRFQHLWTSNGMDAPMQDVWRQCLRGIYIVLQPQLPVSVGNTAVAAAFNALTLTVLPRYPHAADLSKFLLDETFKRPSSKRHNVALVMQLLEILAIELGICICVLIEEECVVLGLPDTTRIIVFCVSSLGLYVLKPYSCITGAPDSFHSSKRQRVSPEAR